MIILWIQIDLWTKSPLQRFVQAHLLLEINLSKDKFRFQSNFLSWFLPVKGFFRKLRARGGQMVKSFNIDFKNHLFLPQELKWIPLKCSLNPLTTSGFDFKPGNGNDLEIFPEYKMRKFTSPNDNSIWLQL